MVCAFPRMLHPWGSLSQVNSLMFNEPRLPDEGFPIFTAYMGFLNSAISLMLNEQSLSAAEFSNFRQF